MRTANRPVLIVFLCATLLTACHTNSNIDKFVSSHYNDQLTKIDKKKSSEIVYTSVYTSGAEISTTTHKVSKFLPLLVYWSWDNRHITALNPQIGVNTFINTVNGLAAKSLNTKLAGRKLELKVEQVPRELAWVDKAHMIFVVLYVFSWDKIYMEPDAKDLIVSYNVTGNGQPAKTGKIEIKSQAKKQGLRFFQSWKSALSEQLGEYNVGVTNMSRSFVTKLAEEL
jgi:hypothetical protein